MILTEDEIGSFDGFDDGVIFYGLLLYFFEEVAVVGSGFDFGLHSILVIMITTIY